MIVYGKRPYTYILYDPHNQNYFLRLAATDWYVRPRTDVNWICLGLEDQLNLNLEDSFLRLGLECGQ